MIEGLENNFILDNKAKMVLKILEECFTIDDYKATVMNPSNPDIFNVDLNITFISKDKENLFRLLMI